MRSGTIPKYNKTLTSCRFSKQKSVVSYNTIEKENRQSMRYPYYTIESKDRRRDQDCTVLSCGPNRDVTFLAEKGNQSSIHPWNIQTRCNTTLHRIELRNSRNSMQCTLHIAHCTLHIAHCTLHISHCTLHIAHCTLHIAHCTLHIAHCIAMQNLVWSLLLLLAGCALACSYHYSLSAWR
jgi:hypothetical protein